MRDLRDWLIEVTAWVFELCALTLFAALILLGAAAYQGFIQ